MKLRLSKGNKLDFDLISSILFQVKNSESRLSQRELAERVGIPHDKLTNMVSLTVACGLMIPRATRLTKLAKIILQNDPYFSDKGSLWLAHYCIGSNPKWFVWNQFTNNIIYKEEFLSQDVILSQFNDLKEMYPNYSESEFKSDLKKEIKTLILAYSEYQLSKLYYIEKEDEEQYKAESPIPVPDLILLAMIIQYREIHSSKSNVIKIDEIIKADNSPGRICRIEDFQFRNSLERLYRNDYLHLESRADLDQIRLKSDSGITDVLTEYYKEAQ